MSVEIIPNLSVSEGAAAVEFYRKAFGAVEVFRLEGPEVFAQLNIEGARFFVAHESHPHRNYSPTYLGGTSVRIDLLCDDPDAMHASAMAAGAIEIEPVGSQDEGPRMGVVEDPFGHRWLIGSHWDPAAS